MNNELQEFLKYIETVINPMRLENHLKLISEKEAIECYELMREFNRKWKLK